VQLASARSAMPHVALIVQGTSPGCWKNSLVVSQHSVSSHPWGGQAYEAVEGVTSTTCLRVTGWPPVLKGPGRS
jgi:hypothetical protein